MVLHSHSRREAGALWACERGESELSRGGRPDYLAVGFHRRPHIGPGNLTLSPLASRLSPHSALYSASITSSSALPAPGASPAPSAPGPPGWPAAPAL